MIEDDLDEHERKFVPTVGINDDPLLVIIYASHTSMNTFAFFPPKTFPYKIDDIRQLHSDLLRSLSECHKPGVRHNDPDRKVAAAMLETLAEQLQEIESWIYMYAKQNPLQTDEDVVFQVPGEKTSGKNMSIFIFPNDYCS